jgi:hypothetical protein
VRVSAALPKTVRSGLVAAVSLEVPAVSFDHLQRLSDDAGLFEHARGVIPRRQHGYCVDDVARALVVLGREPELEPTLVDLAASYLAFVSHAQDSAGRCHNRLGYDRRWHDQAGVDDCWGRALWGLGSIAAGAGPTWLRNEALDRFDVSVACRSPWRRSTAFAALGAVAVLQAHPRHSGARRLLVDALPILGRCSDDPSWPWPEARLTYANATVADALIAAGHALQEEAAVADGLALLTWLFEVQTSDGHLSPVGSGGWGYGGPRPRFDQQPIEACALADAAARALAVTADQSWAACLNCCVSWFVGHNDTGMALYDPVTGGGFDGLEREGRNANQGAESTLAAIATFQLARRLGAGRC